MRIEVSVPGIRKERGKLPAPTTLGALKLALPLAAGPPICGELVGPSLCAPVTGTEVGAPVATEHPVDTEMIRSITVRLRQSADSSRQSPSSGVRRRRVAPSPPTARHRACHRALRCGRPAYAGQSRRQHGSAEHPCMLR